MSPPRGFCGGFPGSAARSRCWCGCASSARWENRSSRGKSEFQMLFFTDFGSGARLRICECCFRRLHVFHHLKGKIRTIRHLCYSNFSPYFFINILYGYVRLALVNVLLVRTLAVWRMKREGKKSDRDTAETRRILHIIQVSCFTIAVYINQ